MANSFLLPLLLCVITIIAVHSQSLPDSTSFKPRSLSAEAEPTCKQTYGFLPCTTTVLGNLFLIIVYGHLMFVAATYLVDGSELQLKTGGPGVFGGLCFPIFGALPGAMITLVSGLSKSKEVAQSQVSIGMGLIAGSTIVLNTVIWGSCVIVGKCDLRELAAVDGQDTKGFDLTGSGVSTDIWTCYAARIMAISVIPFIIVQLPQLLSSSSARHLAVLIALIVSVSMLISYCVYQVVQPWIQKRRIAYAKHRHVISGIMKHLRQRALGKLVNDKGEPNAVVIQKLFDAIDEDKDHLLSASELKALIIGIRFDEIDLDQDDAVEKVLKEFDTSHDSHIDINEFTTAVCTWNVAKRARPGSADAGPQTSKYLNDFHVQTKHEHDLLGPEEVQSDENVEVVENPKWISFKAGMMLLLGTIIAAAIADPLVDAVDNFSDATTIPSFFVSFIALPLATSSREAATAIIFASRKKIRTASLTFSELYGNITTNNEVSLSVFLALVYVRELTWDFSAEVLIILIVCLMMAGLASFRTRFPLWTCCVAFVLYPFSLALLYVLRYVFGWS